MRLRNEIFAHVLDWLIQENKVDDQKDLALKAGISQNTVSRIMTGKVEPSDDTLRRLNAAFGNIFNMQYLRGESTVMLVEDLAYYKSRLNDGEKKGDVDKSSLINAALAAKDETINAHEKTIRAHEQTIKAKQQAIDGLKEVVESLRRENALLRQQLSIYQTNEMIERHPFPVGVSEKDELNPARV